MSPDSQNVVARLRRVLEMQANMIWNHETRMKEQEIRIGNLEQQIEDLLIHHDRNEQRWERGARAARNASSCFYRVKNGIDNSPCS